MAQICVLFEKEKHGVNIYLLSKGKKIYVMGGKEDTGPRIIYQKMWDEFSASTQDLILDKLRRDDCWHTIH